MSQPDFLRRWVICACALGALQSGVSSAQYLRSPGPGSIYKEFTIVMNGNDWRVTDPAAPYVGVPGNSPSDFLPNAVMPLDVDLAGAVRAEALIDYWGGHVGTTGQKMRFNGNAWLTLPALATTPAGRSECYNQQWNVVVEVPLSNLVHGTNRLEGTAGKQTCYNFGWGQWGWYAVTLRVYYGATKPHPTGSIAAPGMGATIAENPRLKAQAQGAAGIDRVEFVAHYDGYDPDGDGRYLDWQHSYQRGLYQSSMRIANHAGTASAAPWETTWNTELVPDQLAGGIKLQARIRDKAGVWFVTDEVAGLTLERPGVSVKLYKPSGVPEMYWVRAGTTRSSSVVIPTADPLERAISAKLLVRTWNGIDGHAEPGQAHYTRVNAYETPVFGANHWYQFDVLDVPVSSLLRGTNTVRFWSQSIHHGIEVLWPGPALLVRYSGALPRCGDAILDAGEQCDDGNGVSGDGCAPDCKTEYCGDGKLQTGLGEQCDDGNAANGDGCDAACRVELLPPRIVEQPTGAVVVEGGSASFDVVAEGTAPLSYAWQRWNGSSWANISGATQTSLTLGSVSLADDGAQFRCRVANSVASVNSDPATLDVVEPASRVTDGLLALYRFDEGSGTTVHDVSGTGIPLDLTIAGATAVRWEAGGGLTLVSATQVASPGPATKITSAVSASGALTVEAWVDPANLTQNGPARIVTISADPYSRNLTLGQGVFGGSAELYDVRLRSSGTSTNGTPSLSTAAGTLTTSLSHVVYTRDAAGTTRIYVDGVERASGTASGNLAGWDPALRLALGNEFDGGTTRAWLGTYELVAFYGRALAPVEVLENYVAGPVHCGPDGAACQDACPDDPAKTDPGQCGCGVPDTDADSDGVADCTDHWPTDATRTGPLVFDRVAAGGGWVTVELPGAYKNPVVIAGVPSLRTGGPGVVQLRNVGPTSFQIRFKEWRYQDGVHTAERIPYIVLEAGRYAMDDGSTWEAGRYDLGDASVFKPFGFSSAFPAEPALLLGVQTTNGGDPVAVRARNVTAAGFEAGLFEEEALTDGKHVTEQVGYLAVHAAAAGGLVYAAGQYRPYVLARVQLDSTMRPVGEWLVKVEEEKSKDPETAHGLESVSTLAIEGKLYGQIVSFVGPDPCALRYKLP